MVAHDLSRSDPRVVFCVLSLELTVTDFLPLSVAQVVYNYLSLHHFIQKRHFCDAETVKAHGGGRGARGGVGRVVVAAVTHSPEEPGRVASPRPTPFPAASAPGVPGQVRVAAPRPPQPDH